MIRKKYIIGLCGGIGSGKSTVAGEFAKLGCAVIDADAINHELLATKEVMDVLVGWWGPRILDNQGQINRHTVGKIVFQDEREMKKLTDYIHPLVIHREQELIDKYNNDNNIRAIILDVPLLIETRQHQWCDHVVFVDAEEAIRHERIHKKRGWDKKRINFAEKMQIGLDKKVEISDYRVDNNSGIPGVASQTATILSRILESEED
jgi:dephospho-CoA kinase